MNNQSTYDLKVGYLCNNRCVHCAIYNYRKQLISQNIPTELTLDQIKRQIDLHCDKYDAVVITGGEVTVRKDFRDIITYSCEKFNRVGIQTNGRKLADFEWLPGLANKHNISFAIAVHGSCGEIHDKITTVQNSWKQTIEGIKFLVSNNVTDICGKIVVSQYNQNDIFNTIKLLISLGIKHINIAFVHGVGSAYNDRYNIIPTYNNIKHQINQSIVYGNEHNTYIDLETIPYCQLDIDNFDRSCDCKNPSNSFVCPVNQTEYDWNKARLTDKCKRSSCNRCIMDKVCEGVWNEYVEMYGDDELIPIFPDKPKIEYDSFEKCIALLKGLSCS